MTASPSPSPSASTTGTGTAAMTTSASGSATATMSVTTTAQSTTSVTSTAQATGTTTPTTTHTPTATPTATHTTTPTATQTATPTASPIVNQFKNSSVMVLRLGNSATQGIGNGLTLPVYLDEVDPTGVEVVLSGSAVVRSVALPTTCMLATGGTILATGVGTLAAGSGYIWFDTEVRGCMDRRRGVLKTGAPRPPRREIAAATPYCRHPRHWHNPRAPRPLPPGQGFPSLSTDGTLVSFACYRAYTTVGATVLDASTNLRTIAAVYGNGAINVATIAEDGTNVAWPYGGTSSNGAALHTALWSASNSMFYLSAAPGYDAHSSFTGGGVVTITLGGTSLVDAISPDVTPGNVGDNDARCLAIFGTTLYATDSSLDSGLQGVLSFGTGLPTAQKSVTSISTPSGYAPWNMIFENANSMWTSDTSNLATFNVVQYTLSGSTWSVGKKPLLASGQRVYSIAGRYEVGGAGFIIYGTTPTALYRYDTGSSSLSTVTTATAGTVFRGVTLPPRNAAYETPTPFPTMSLTATPSNSFGVTGTPTLTTTQTQTTSSTATATASTTAQSTATATITASNTPTATITASNTPTATTTASHTATPTNSATNTATNTASRTQTPTQTASVTSTSSTSATLSVGATPSPTNTASASGTAAPTPSITGTPTVTPSASPIVNQFKNSSVMVLRLGNSATQGIGNGLTLPVYLDEVDPTGVEVVLSGSAVVRSVALPTTCMLATGGTILATGVGTLAAGSGYIWFDTEVRGCMDRRRGERWCAF